MANLLGRTCANILIHLDRPATMGELVTVTACHPNQATVSCDRLVAAGLVERHRHGRTVRVNRTELGTQLLELYRETPRNLEDSTFRSAENAFG